MFEVIVQLDETPAGLHPFDVVFDYEENASDRNAFDLVRLRALSEALDQARQQLRLQASVSPTG